MESKRTYRRTWMPLMVMAPAYAAGLMAGKPLVDAPWWLALPLAVGIMVAILAQWKRKWAHSGNVFLSGMALVFLAVGMGYSSLWFRPAPDRLALWEGHEVLLRAEVATLPKATRNGHRLELELDSIQPADGSLPWQRVSGRTWAYVGADSVAELPSHARVELKARIKPLKGGKPSFLAWMQQQGITHVAQAEDGSLRQTGTRGGLMPALDHLREGLVRQMLSLMPDPRTGAFAVALMLGDRRGLDADIKADFSAAGLMHVLAISGMHVCLVLVVLDGLIRALSVNVRMRRVGEVLALCLLVAYGLLSGASPAVMRAVLMVALVLVARMAHLRTHPLNLLAAAGLVQLVWNPSALWDAGFQLSYAAMAGILLWSRPWEQGLTKALPWLPGAVSGNVAMTMAAQVATLPLIWYHFGQFPTYFLLSNLATMFLASWAVRIGFFAMAFCFVPVVNTVLHGMLDFLLWALIEICSLIAGLPGATVTRISFHDTGFCISVGLLLAGAAVMAWSLRRRKARAVKAPSWEDVQEG